MGNRTKKPNKNPELKEYASLTYPDENVAAAAATIPWGHNTLKDPCNFNFLTIDIEQGLMAHIQKFLIELGQGFAFVGQQYHLEIGDQDFYIDLLFYHLTLRCFVVVELKNTVFVPEYAGKLNFY